jgi:hypothetical protein
MHAGNVIGQIGKRKRIRQVKSQKIAGRIAVVYAN